MSDEQLALPGMGRPRRTPGMKAVIDWSLGIHHRGSERHLWAVAAARAMDAAGPDAEFGRFPSPFGGVPEDRAETVRRLWRAAMAP